MPRLGRLPSLESISFKDAHFGENPLVGREGYRDAVLCALRGITTLDAVPPHSDPICVSLFERERERERRGVQLYKGGFLRGSGTQAEVTRADRVAARDARLEHVLEFNEKVDASAKASTHCVHMNSAPSLGTVCVFTHTKDTFSSPAKESARSESRRSFVTSRRRGFVLKRSFSNLFLRASAR